MTERLADVLSLLIRMNGSSWLGNAAAHHDESRAAANWGQQQAGHTVLPLPGAGLA